MSYFNSQDSLQRYFDEMLSESSEIDKNLESKVEPTYKESEALETAALANLQRQKLQTLLNQQLQQPVLLQEQQSSRSTQTQTTSIDPLKWHNNGRPIWAQEAFDVLLFKVSGLTLAVPLVALGQIQPMSEKLTPIFGQSDWFMGLLPTGKGHIKTVNTALFVMPERYDDHFLKTARFIISIHGLPWGLAVDSVDQPSRLDPDEVKWRGDRSKRPWLAGTVKSAMCALIDISKMGELLEASEVSGAK